MAKKSQVKVPPLVLIEWVDAVTEDTPWPTESEIADLIPETVFAVGWLIFQDKTHYKLAQQWNKDGAGGVWSIPKSGGCKVTRLTQLFTSAEMKEKIKFFYDVAELAMKRLDLT